MQTGDFPTYHVFRDINVFPVAQMPEEAAICVVGDCVYVCTALHTYLSNNGVSSLRCSCQNDATTQGFCHSTKPQHGTTTQTHMKKESIKPSIRTVQYLCAFELVFVEGPHKRCSFPLGVLRLQQSLPCAETIKSALGDSHGKPNSGNNHRNKRRSEETETMHAKCTHQHNICTSAHRPGRPAGV